MKTIIPFCFFICLFTQISYSQVSDTIPTMPDEQIIVNKEYDEEGNLIRYDSTYIYKFQNDTIFGLPGILNFHQKFFSGNAPFDNLFETDSIMDIFNDSLLIYPFSQLGQTGPNLNTLEDMFKKYFDNLDQNSIFYNEDLNQLWEDFFREYENRYE